MKVLERLKNAANHVLYDAKKPLTSADMLNTLVDKAATAEHAITKLEQGQSITPGELKELQWSVEWIVATLEYVHQLKERKPIQEESSQ